MIAALALATALGVSPSPAPSIARARAVLVGHDFPVTDETQPDRPDYDLTFTRAQSASLRADRRHGGNTFTFEGTARDLVSGTDVSVRFTFAPPRRLTRFRGPPANLTQPAFPIRATFYYGWYPEAWSRAAIYPYTRFHPSLGFYELDEPDVVSSQLAALRYGNLDAAVFSWWGADGYPPTDPRFHRFLAASRATPFRWAAYYEREGYADPSVEQIRADLRYLRDQYASAPAYLRVGDRFVVFVYGGAADSCETARRWAEANTVGAYIVLSGFGGYRDCPWQPQAWHQYSADRAAYALAPDAFMISPGFDEAASQAPALARDPARWRENIAAMVASEAPWQLVISFNEWAEGTSVESAREWATSSGHGAYLDALHEGLPLK